MKVYKLEVMVIDFDNCGGEDIKDMIQDARYPNRAISPTVKNIESVDIGEWTDDHPLNNRSTSEAEYKRLFTETTSLECSGPISNGLAMENHLGLTPKVKGMPSHWPVTSQEFEED
jgi:hypothetical protein